MKDRNSLKLMATAIVGLCLVPVFAANSFSQSISFAPATTTGALLPGGIAVGGVNGDGETDLAIANGANQYNINATATVYHGDGSGSFPSMGSYGNFVGTRAVAMGDFNGDGKLDMALANDLLPSGSESHGHHLSE